MHIRLIAGPASSTGTFNLSKWFSYLLHIITTLLIYSGVIRSPWFTQKVLKQKSEVFVLNSAVASTTVNRYSNNSAIVSEVLVHSAAQP